MIERRRKKKAEDGNIGEERILSSQRRMMPMK